MYAYATLGSVDATQWQLLERKARFIAAALSGDRSIRRLEDVGSQANQFAMAKALASGDPRLMQKAGLDMEIARLRRLRAAHFDDQQAVRRVLAESHAQTASSRTRCGQIEADLVRRTPTRGELFIMEVNGKQTAERRLAGNSLLSRVRILAKERETGEWTLARLGGFEVKAEGRHWSAVAGYQLSVWLDRTGYEQEAEIRGRPDAPGSDRPARIPRSTASKWTWPSTGDASPRRRPASPATRSGLGGGVRLPGELDAKQAELDAIEADLAKPSNDNDSAPAVRRGVAAVPGPRLTRRAFPIRRAGRRTADRNKNEARRGEGRESSRGCAPACPAAAARVRRASAPAQARPCPAVRDAGCGRGHAEMERRTNEPRRTAPWNSGPSTPAP